MDPCDVERVLWEKWQPVFCLKVMRWLVLA